MADELGQFVSALVFAQAVVNYLSFYPSTDQAMEAAGEVAKAARRYYEENVTGVTCEMQRVSARPKVE